MSNLVDMSRMRLIVDSYPGDDMNTSQPKYSHVAAADVRVGDVLEVWSRPDTVTAIRSYDGPIECLQGGWIFEFAIWQIGMTADSTATFLKRAE